MRYQLLVFATALIAAQIVVAQSGNSSTCDVTSCKVTFTFGPAGITNVASAAYSGQESREMVRILADGIRVTLPIPFLSTQIYRDSQGRIRAERAMFPSRPGTKPPVDISLIEIQDPLAGYLYVLDSVHHMAHRVTVHPPEPIIRPSFVYDAPGATPAGDTVYLGTKFMFGVTLTGRKITSVSRMRNGESIINVDEMWTDPQTNVEVLRKSVSPNVGFSRTVSIQNYSNAEPDSALFLVPSGYQVVDESGPFTIEVSRTPEKQQTY